MKGRFLWANWDVDELKARASEIEAGEESMWSFEAAEQPELTGLMRHSMLPAPLQFTKAPQPLSA